MTAFLSNSGNGTIPSQSEHDAHYGGGDTRRTGLITLGRLGIFYTYDPDADDYQVDDIKLAPAVKPSDLWRNNDTGAKLIDAIKAVLDAQGSTFAELIGEHRDEAQEQPV